MARRVLIVDDSSDDAELTEFALREGGLVVDCRRVHHQGGLHAVLDGFEPHLVLCDLNMPGWSGHEAVEAVRDRAPAARVFFLTGALHGDEDLSHVDAAVLKDDTARLLALARPIAASV